MALNTEAHRPDMWTNEETMKGEITTENVDAKVVFARVDHIPQVRMHRPHAYALRNGSICHCPVIVNHVSTFYSSQSSSAIFTIHRKC